MEEPFVPLPSFLGFHGDIELLSEEPPSTSISVFSPHLEQGSVRLLSEINFGHGLDQFSWDILQPLIVKEARNHPELFLGKTGIDATKIFDLYDATIDSSNPPAISPIDSNTLLLMAYNLYWNLLKESIPDLRPIIHELPNEHSEQYFDYSISCNQCENTGCEAEINPFCPIISLGKIHLVLLWHVFDVGFRNHRHLDPLISAARSGNPIEMIPVLIRMVRDLDELNPDENDRVWNRRRIREILHLLRREPLVSNSLGSESTNESEDLVRVGKRLNELGYLANTEFTITGTTQDSEGNTVNEYDFSPLVQFYQIVNQSTQTNHNLLPESRSHLRLLSSNVARWEEINDNLPGIDISALTQTHTTSWMNHVLSRISNRYRRIVQAQNGFSPTSTQNIVILSISSNGDQFVISLPMLNGASNSSAVSDPSYDRDAMRLMLQAIGADDQIPNSTFVHLSDPELAREGFCTLRGHDSNVVLSENYVTIRLVSPDLEMKINLPEQPETSTETDLTPVSLSTTPIEQIIDFLGSRYTPDDDDGTFDYYFDAIVENWDPALTPPSVFPPDTVMILGVRGWSLHRWRSPIWDTWCDSIIMLWIDDSNQKRFESFFAATRPGKLRGFDNIKGDSHLEPGQYIYKFNDNNNPKSLVPAAGISIRRDPIKCGYPDSNLPVEVGLFDISISEGGDESHKVGRSSRGSQVIFNKPENGIFPFDQFMQILVNNHTGNDFVYTLIDGADLIPHGSDTGGGV